MPTDDNGQGVLGVQLPGAYAYPYAVCDPQGKNVLK
jgi:hypothetical protein